jgi:hypothetical protein
VRRIPRWSSTTMKTTKSAIFLCAVISAMLVSQDAKFVASVERTTVAAGEQFEVLYTLSGSGVGGGRNFQPPDFGQFVILSGPNQSTNMQIINGQISSSVTYSYVLYARQPGKYTIGPARVEVRGSVITSNPLTIEVTQARSRQAPDGRSESPPEAQNIGENLFIRATVNKNRVLRGEQITVEYKLYTRVNVSGYDISKAPAYEGFWAEEIEQPRQPDVTTEQYEGRDYRVATIRKTALFPTQAGKLTIPPLEVRCAVQVQAQRRRGSDPFDLFFNDPFFQRLQTVEYNFKSNPVTVTVDPLPSHAPATFTGAVGSFTFQASFDKKEVQAGDPLTLKLVVSGTGNVKLLTLPRPQLPGDMEAYEPKISDELTREGAVIRGKKSAEYLVVARNPGLRVIESIPFTYFDLTKREYVTLRSPRFEITIKGGKEIAGSVAPATKSDVKLLGQDIRFLKMSFTGLKKKENRDGGFWMAGALVLPPLLFVGALLYGKRIEKIYGDLPSLRSQKAGREATKRLKRASNILQRGDTESYHAEISRALLGYLRDKLRIPPASLTLDEAVTQLGLRGVPHETVEQLRSCIERAEFARFAPASDTKEARRDLLEMAAHVIQTIERSLDGKV